jgi:hypothetical protein
MSTIISCLKTLFLNKKKPINENESTEFDPQQPETTIINAVVSNAVYIGQNLFINRIETNTNGIKTIYLGESVDV